MQQLDDALSNQAEQITLNLNTIPTKIQGKAYQVATEPYSNIKPLKSNKKSETFFSDSKKQSQSQTSMNQDLDHLVIRKG